MRADAEQEERDGDEGNEKRRVDGLRKGRISRESLDLETDVSIEMSGEKQKNNEGI